MPIKSVRPTLFALGLAAFVPCADAETTSDADIARYLNARYTGLAVTHTKRVFEGALDPLKEVIVVTFSLAYPTGRDLFDSSEFEALTTEHGRLKTITMGSLPIGQVENVSVRDGVIHMLTRTVGKGDQPCRPTDPHSFDFTVASDLSLTLSAAK